MTRRIPREQWKEANATVKPEGAHARPLSPSSISYPFLLPAVEADEIGRLGNYRVLRPLGRGGMGFVFRAEDITLRRAVALKVMNPALDGALHGWERFLREARVMAAIKHESLVTVFQAGQQGAVIYLAMELLEGTSLEDWCAGPARPPLAEILRVGREIANGLAAIHRHGLVHRDLKPANLWLEGAARRVKILDFGLARFVQDDATLTQTGAVLGTPSFMSPEQARGEEVDARSDLFSFGSVLYSLCTGVSPFQARNTTAVLTALAVQDPAPVVQLNPAIPRPLSDLVSRLLAKNPQDRPRSAEEVLHELRQIEVSEGASCPTRVPVVAVSGLRHDTVRMAPERTAGSGRRWTKVALAVALAAAAAVAAPYLLPSMSTPASPPAAPAAAGPAAPPAPVGPAKVYLSDLQLVHKEHWPFVPPLPPPEEGPPGKGPPRLDSVRVRGKVSPHGIFMHPPPAHEGAAKVSYRLDKQFSTFRAQVSLNDGPPPPEMPCEFKVCGDGRELWKSRPISSQADAETCSVSVAGVNTLTIEVRSFGDPRAAHAVWIEPHVAR
jgi:tRNA A-37 threonylcarbamoyl transferase component Bud32